MVCCCLTDVKNDCIHAVFHEYLSVFGLHSQHCVLDPLDLISSITRLFSVCQYSNMPWINTGSMRGSPVGVTLKGLTLWLPSWCEGLERLPTFNIWTSGTPPHHTIPFNTSCSTHTHSTPTCSHLSPFHIHCRIQTKPYREIRPAIPWLTLICSVNTEHYEPIETACLAVATRHGAPHLSPQMRALSPLDNFWLAPLLELWGTLINTFIWVRHHHADLLLTVSGSADWVHLSPVIL